MESARCVERMVEHRSFPIPTEQNPIVFFDMDGVLTAEKSSWNYVHRALGVDNSKNYAMFLEDRITYEEFMRRDIALWIEKYGKMEVDQITEILDEIDLFPGAERATRILLDANFRLVLVSAGIMWLAQRVSRETNIQHVYANSILSLGGKVIPEGRPMVDPKHKDSVVKNVINQFHPAFTVSVGDSPEDESMFSNTDYSISFNNSPDYTNKFGINLRCTDLVDCSELIISIMEERDGKL